MRRAADVQAGIRGKSPRPREIERVMTESCRRYYRSERAEERREEEEKKEGERRRSLAGAKYGACYVSRDDQDR